MKVFVFNDALMNAAKAFGIDLVNEKNLERCLDLSELSYAATAGEALISHFSLGTIGLTSASEKIREDDNQDSLKVLFETGMIDSEKRLTSKVNVIATKTNALIFYVGDEDQESPIGERVLKALGQIMRVEEILVTPIWSHYCKYARC